LEGNNDCGRAKTYQNIRPQSSRPTSSLALHADKATEDHRHQKSGYKNSIAADRVQKQIHYYLPIFITFGLTCKDDWRGPGGSQVRDKRLCLEQAIVKQPSSSQLENTAMEIPPLFLRSQVRYNRLCNGLFHKDGDWLGANKGNPPLPFF